MDLPLQDLMDEHACYVKLLGVLHPEGLGCPRCAEKQRLRVHRRDRDPVLDYRCLACGRVFNAFSGTRLQGTHKRPSEVVLLMRGFAQGVSTARLSREMGLSRGHLLEFRHQVQARAASGLDRTALPNAVVEADEMYQNAGEKRRTAQRPRRSAQKARQSGARARHVGTGSSAGAGRGRP